MTNLVSLVCLANICKNWQLILIAKEIFIFFIVFVHVHKMWIHDVLSNVKLFAPKRSISFNSAEGEQEIKLILEVV